jgi:23S rRNA (uridine2552-2'-O)-methyltransferase
MQKKPNNELNPSNKGKKQKLKKNKNRKLSSTNWIKRQVNDPYVIEANRLGYKSRAAFKLLQIDKKFNFLKPGKIVIDLGCAPGGWLQVAAKKVYSSEKNISVVGVDLLPVSNIYGTKTIVADINEEDTEKKILNLIDKKPDIILSDMAANTTGHKQTDHLRTTQLTEIALRFAINHLNKGGVFLVKTFRGGSEKTILETMKKNFSYVKNVKPLASRPESVESYTICIDLKL